MEIQGPIIAKKTILEDKNNRSAKGITILDFTLHQRLIIIETPW